MCDENDFTSKWKECCEPFFGHHGIPPFVKMFREQMKACCGNLWSDVPYNVEEVNDSYIVTVLLPGRAKEDVKVSLINNYLNVTAPKPKDAQAKPEDDKTKKIGGYLRYSFKFVDVDMDIQLPADANADDVKSVLTNGVLKIKVGKKPAKNINVSGEN